MKKFFIKADTVRNDAFALAKKLIDEDYIPDIMFVSMRGGAEMGNAMNEFFKFALGKNYKTIFATVVAHSTLYLTAGHTSLKMCICRTRFWWLMIFAIRARL